MNETVTGRLDGIEACVFDAYGTLFDVHSAVASLRKRVGPLHAELSAQWRVRQLEYTWLRSLMREHVDFWQLTGDALRVTLQTLGLMDTALHDELMQAYLTLEAFPEVKRALTLLKRAGIPTAILTNGTPAMIEAAVSSAGLEALIGQQLSIESVGIYKPDPRVYQLAVDSLGIAAGNISFQSSNGWDAAGAAHFGFQVAWINRYSQPLEALPGELSVELPDLEGLPALLGIC
jgi:2-haloacid dehalogenase